MRSALCNAVVRCQARRLGQTAAAAPLPAAILVIVVLLSPIALARVGHAVGSEVAGVVGTGGVADALVVGPVLAAAVAGAALAVSLPGRSALGQQVAAGPCGSITAIVAGLLVPALIAVLTVLPSLVALCIALAVELPGGGPAGLALALATIASVPAGAVLAEGVIAAARGRRQRFLGIAGGSLVWAVTGAAVADAPGAALLGPFAPVGAALRGSASAWPGLAAASGALLALVLAWVSLAAARPERRLRIARRGRRIVRGRWFSVPAALAVLLTRRDDVRLAIVGAFGFGAAGVALATATDAPAPTPFLLATTTALLGSILFPLAVCGVLLHGRWLWVGGPGDRHVIGLAACLIGMAGSAIPVAVVGAGAVVFAGAPGNALGVVAGIVVVASATALVAGALVPWSSEGVGDQLTTFAALAALAVGASVTVGAAAPRLVSLGLPDGVVVVLVCGASIGAALHALDRRLGVAT